MPTRTVCHSGRHDWTPENIHTGPTGFSYCVACRKAAKDRRRTSAPAPDWTWHDDAACKGESLELFFGPDGERQPEREAREAKAKEICSQCPVRTLCADDAIARRDLWGVRGGMAPEELAAERKRRMRRAHTGRAA